MAAVRSGANRHDGQLLAAAVAAIPPVCHGRPGRPRCRPEKLHADQGYAHGCCRQALRRRGILPRIARRGIESSQRLGRHRWRGEQPLAWLHRYRRLRLRYEQRDDIPQAFLSLGCALICFKQLQRFC